MTVYTIPASVPFLAELVRYILTKIKDDPLKSADICIILPTERACLALEQELQQRGQPLVLPQIRSLTSWIQPPKDSRQLMTPLQRHLLLSHLLLEKTRSSWSDCFSLASSLMTLLDIFYTEEVEIEKLETLVPAELSDHWQHSLNLLRIITQEWPEHLSALNLQEPLVARQEAFDAQGEQWQLESPPGPVIAAGVVGTVPSVARFLKGIASLNQGEVIFSDLDLTMTSEEWDMLPAYHPQYGLKQTLDRMGKTRQEVQPWPLGSSSSLSPPVRSLLFKHLFNSKGLQGPKIEQWLQEGALDTLELIEVSSLQEEARCIALMMRHALETSHSQIALVTPHRSLSDRVTAELKRWQIVPNDSYGQSLMVLPEGVLLHLTLKVALNPHDTVSILALLKHPLTRLGLSAADCRRQARRLELKYFRTIFPTLQFDPQHIAEEDLKTFYENFKATYLPLLTGPALLQEWAKRHRSMLESVIQTSVQEEDLEENKTSLFSSSEEGKALRDLFEHLESLSSSQLFTLAEYTGLLTRTLKNIRILKNYGLHPRIHILGPLEARLIHYDVLILGSMNDLHWSEPTLPNPWLSPEMRQQLGLPDERYHGGLMAAHWIKALHSKKVILTRAQREKGMAVLPSRWLLRLKAILKSHQQEHLIAPRHPWHHWAQILDDPKSNEAVKNNPSSLRPQPCPPVSLRPRHLSITDVQLWLQDPYGLYAKKILALSPLPSLDPEVTPSLFGIIVHRVLEEFIHLDSDTQTLDQLLKLGRQAFELYFTHPVVRVLWWPRFTRLCAWFHEEQRYRLPMIKEIHSEVRGSLTFETNQGPFTIIGTADRIDILKDGTLEIIDYKTGTLPTRKAVVDGEAVQLPLEAAIARYGTWKDIPVENKLVKAVSFWQLKGGMPAGQLLRFDEADKLADQILELLKQRITDYDQATFPYTASAENSNIYDPLARRQEWRTRQQLLITVL